MLGGTRGLDARPAPARRGRVPRAPHAAHQPAHEHRGARRRKTAPAPPSGERAAPRRRRAARRDDDPDRRAHRARARRAASPSETEDVRLDLLAADAVERSRRNRPGVDFSTDSRNRSSTACPTSLERAIGNLLDNAAKWSPPGGEVEVALRDGEFTVRDHGPGIDEEDLPYVFDRFYRAHRPAGCPARASGSRSSARWRSHTAARCSRSGPRAAAHA